MDHSGFQRAQQLDLHLQGTGRNFVQKQSAAMRFAKTSQKRMRRAEHLFFDAVWCQRRTVQRDKFLVAAWPKTMQRAGDQFLACSRFAGDQHRGIGQGEVNRFFLELGHTHIATQQHAVQSRQRHQLFPHTFGHVRQAMLFRRMLENRQKPSRFERLFQKGVSPVLDGIHRHRNIAMC